MATRNLTVGGGTGPNEIDLIGVLGLTLLPIAASFLFEVFTLEINVFTSYDLTAPPWTVGRVDSSIVLRVVLGSIAWVGMTNIANSETDWSQEETIAVGSALLPVLYVFVPAVESLVVWHDLMQLAAAVWVGPTTVYMSYRGWFRWILRFPTRATRSPPRSFPGGSDATDGPGRSQPAQIYIDARGAHERH